MTEKQKPTVHYAEVLQRIDLKQGQLRSEVTYRFICGAQDGEGIVLSWRGVTCQACKRSQNAKHPSVS